MKRRDFLSSGLAASLGAAALAAGGGCQHSAKTLSQPWNRRGNRPNILFILADDMGYGDLGFHGNPLVETPNLDRFALEGTCLTQHYAAAPVCAPSRAALVTGLYPQRTGQSMTREWHGIHPSVSTAAARLCGAGYATGLVGKWHLEDSGPDPKNEPWHMGFQECVKAPALSDYWDWTLDFQGKKIESDGRYITDALTDEGMAFIERHAAGDPFYLYLSYTAPHYPIQSREEDAEVFRAKGDLDEGVVQTYGMIRRLDYNIGRVLEKLKLLNIEENTLVIFASDNGPFLWDWEGMDQRRYNAHMSGMKGNILDGGLRVPGLARWPAGIAPSERANDSLVHFVDWTPTMLSAAGVSYDPQEFDGEDVLPILRGECEASEDKACFWSWNHRCETIEANSAMRQGPWKYVRPFWMHVSSYETGDLPAWDELPPQPKAMLFRLDVDPGEQRDLSALCPDRAAAMQRELEKWWEGVMRDFRRLNG